ncbi:glycoside hydrolase [Algoriphagus marinus]|uniref:glycoside hydrolase n=1 Tax=Algoriphagus marinus TaxID=1925762 RepID=UPI001FE95A46|nr:glycoside hydrolase [Algoriphagus marinus]
MKPEIGFQTIDHFGASDAWSIQFVGNWPDTKREAIANLLFSKEMENGKPNGIGLSMWRFNLGAGSAEQGAASGIKDEWRRAESFIGTNGNIDMKKAAGQVWFAKAAKESGVEKLLLFSNSPPIQFTKNRKAYSSDGKSNLDESKSKDFANYISSVFLGLNQLGLEPTYISPVNEPQWDWSDGGQEGSPYLNSEIVSLVKTLNESLEENNIKAKIDIAEAGKINYLFEKADKPSRGEQIKTFFDKSSPNYLGDLNHVSMAISGHSYFTTSPIDASSDLRVKLSNEISSIPGLAYWMSEYCILGGNEGEINGNERDLGMTSALYLARVIHQDLTFSNASAWNWWIAVSPYNYKDGLIYIDKNKEDGNFYESKMLWALGNFSRFIRPGFERIGVEMSVANQEKIFASGFQDPKSKEIVLVLINSNSEILGVSLEGYSEKNTTLKAYLTNENSNLEPIEIEPEKFHLHAESIMTLVFSSK